MPWAVFLMFDICLFYHAVKDEDEPAWAPLRDTYMLGSKLKDWDKMKVMSPH